MNPWAVVRAIMLAPDLNLKEKSLLLFIRACQGADGTSYPSVGSMGLVIGTNKREVVQGVLSKLEDSGHIKRHHRLGKSTLYSLPEQTMSSVLRAYQDLVEQKKQQRQPAPKTGAPQGSEPAPKIGAPKTGAPPNKVPPKIDEPAPKIGAPGCPQIGGTKELVKEEYTQVAAAPLNTRPMAEFANEHVDAHWTQDGGIEVLNGFRAKLLEQFPHVDLNLGLIQVAAETDKRADLKRAILRKFAMIEQIERGKNRRYVQASSTPKRGVRSL